jgi:DNA-binding transcriptional ArsR family regulator
MNQTQKEILHWLRLNTRKQGMGASVIADKLKKRDEKIQVELAILRDNNLIECVTSGSGRIMRAKINSQGESYFTESTKIVNKETVKDTLTDIKDRLSKLESALEELERNPTEANKKSFIEKLDTFQSVANGIAPIVKAGIDLFK